MKKVFVIALDLRDLVEDFRRRANIKDDVAQRHGRTVLDIERELFPLPLLVEDMFPQVLNVHKPHSAELPAVSSMTPHPRTDDVHSCGTASLRALGVNNLENRRKYTDTTPSCQATAHNVAGRELVCY